MKNIITNVLLACVVLVLVLITSVCCAGLLYHPPLSIPAGFAGKPVALEVGPASGSARIDRVRLRVLQEGTGRDVLMIHGSPGSLEDFAPQAKALAGSFHVTRYDRPGHALSSSGDMPISESTRDSFSLAYNARVALSLIEKLKLERVIVVGHSYGGATALALALLQSPQVSAYVVIDSAVYKNARPLKEAFKYLALPVFGLGLARLARRSEVTSRIEKELPMEFSAGPPPAGFVALRGKL